MAKTIKYNKRIPDDAKITLSIRDDVHGIESTAELSGEMVNIADVYHDQTAISIVFNEMKEQMLYDGSEGMFPPNADISIDINSAAIDLQLCSNVKGQDLNEMFEKHQALPLNGIFDLIVEKIKYSEEVELVIPENNE